MVEIVAMLVLKFANDAKLFRLVAINRVRIDLRNALAGLIAGSCCIICRRCKVMHIVYNSRKTNYEIGDS